MWFTSSPAYIYTLTFLHRAIMSQHDCEIVMLYMRESIQRPPRVFYREFSRHTGKSRRNGRDVNMHYNIIFTSK